jgi:hypothetical protein
MSTMPRKKLLLIPLILIIISVITSIIAFQKNAELELGNIYVEDGLAKTTYGGEYFAVIGSIDYDAYYMSVSSLSNHLKITTYDSEENIQKEFLIVIKEKDQEYDSDIVTSLVSLNKVEIDNMEDYLFRVNLEAGVEYELSQTRIDDNPDTNNIDVVLVNMPENIYNMKTLMESVSFTTAVFAVVSGVTLLAIYFIRKDR